jgi:S1-C subfamily serine protease
MSAGTLLSLNERHVKRRMGPSALGNPMAPHRQHPSAPDRRLHRPRPMLMAGRRFSVATGFGLALVFASLPAAAQPSSAPSRMPSLPSSDVVSDDDAPAPPAKARNSPDPSADPPAPPPLTPRQLYEHVRRGVVVIERGGMPSALGTVLGGDGRVLTALSGLAGATSADVRYADGTDVHAKVTYSDPSLDLALLAPESGHHTEGLSASEADAATTLIRAMLPGRVGHLGPATVGIKGRADAHAHGGGPLLRMLDVDVQGIPVVGAPLLDPAGSVVAVLVRACKGQAHAEVAEPLPGSWPSSPAVTRPASGGDSSSSARAPSAGDAVCQPVVVGAPIATVRSFLAQSAVQAAAAVPAASSAPWLGIRGEPQDAGGMHGVRVVDVAPSSPAEKAGLKPGVDVIVAVDGRPIDKPEALGESISKHAIGDFVKLLVFGGGKFREVSSVLVKGPVP